MSVVNETQSEKKNLSEYFLQNPYVSYTYSYPHKSAYHHWNCPKPLKNLWKEEETSNLFLYFHVPFCVHKCGYCNLFSQINPHSSIVDSYLNAMKRQSSVVKKELNKNKTLNINKVAIGGGTPTYLTIDQLNILFKIIEETFQEDLNQVDISIETHPDRTNEKILNFLKEKGVDRISVGIQSFLRKELNALSRKMDLHHINSLLSSIKELSIESLNIDLIYGIANQTVTSFLSSIENALAFEPEEIYIYPLYIRPKTGLSKNTPKGKDLRLKMYHEGRKRLLQASYTQVSMRHFYNNKVIEKRNICNGQNNYNCSIDGMIGLGVGARSYTRNFHYSEPYAISQPSVSHIIRDFSSRTNDSFKYSTYGIMLSEEDVRRRYILKNLLRLDGVDLNQYFNLYKSPLFKDFHELRHLIEADLAFCNSDNLILNQKGISLSDSIGPWFYSERVLTMMEKFELK